LKEQHSAELSVVLKVLKEEHSTTLSALREEHAITLKAQEKRLVAHFQEIYKIEKNCTTELAFPYLPVIIALLCFTS
jgi:hypothetical protein